MRVVTQEHETSKTETRWVPLAHAQILGERGGFYRVQIIDDYFDVIIAEYKNGRK